MIFNPENTMISTNDIFSATMLLLLSSINFAPEIEQVDYKAIKNVQTTNKIPIEKEISGGSGDKSIYFRDISSTSQH